MARANPQQNNLKPATKEALNYAEALKHGYRLLRNVPIIRINTIIEIQKINSPPHAEIRKIPGTFIKNKETDETVHIRHLMGTKSLWIYLIT